MNHQAQLIVKRNDKNTAPGKEHLGLKHGDIVDVIDNQDSAWEGNSLENMMSERMREAFCLIQIDPSKVKQYRKLLKSISRQSDKQNYRPRKRRLNINKLAKLIGDKNLNGKLHSGENLPILNGLLLSDDDFDDASLLNNNIQFEDVKAISSGNATVGVGGGGINYLTWTCFYADIANLIADLTGTQVNNTTEGAAATITELLGGHTFSCLTDTNHLGNNNNGWLTSINHNQNGFNFAQEGLGTTIVDELKFIRAVAGSATTSSFMRIIGVTTSFNFHIRNCLFDGGNLQGAGIRISDAQPILFIYGNMLWNVGNYGILLDSAEGNASSVYEDNAIYNCARGFRVSNNAGLLRNNSVFGNTVSDYLTIGNATGYNNADSDGTAVNGNWAVGAANQPNLAIINQWQSITPGDGDTFLLPVQLSTIAASGTIPTYATTLINGVTWTSEIGAKGVYGNPNWYNYW